MQNSTVPADPDYTGDLRSSSIINIDQTDANITDDLLPFLDDDLLKDLTVSALELVRFNVYWNKEFKSLEAKVIGTADVTGVVTIGHNELQSVNSEWITKGIISCAGNINNGTQPSIETIQQNVNATVDSAEAALTDHNDTQSIVDWFTEAVIQSDIAVRNGQEQREKQKESDQPPKSGDQISTVEPCNSQIAELTIQYDSSDTAKIDLEQVIRKTKDGTAIWNMYQTNKELRDSDRDAIAAAIINHELQITAGRFVYLAEQVLATFPTETLCVWALVEPGGRFVTGKGKLYSRWSNARRKYIQLKLIPASRSGRNGSNVTALTPNHGEPCNSRNTEFDQSKDDIILWLKNNGTPWVTVEKNWAETSAARRYILINEKTAIHAYLKEYPALKDPRGYMLLETDFNTLYPNKSKALFASWLSLRNFLKQKLPSVCGTSADSIQDSTAQTNFFLINLSRIFRVVNARKQKKSVKEWRPSKCEVQEAFVLHVKVIGDLDVKLEERRSRLSRFGCRLQPLAAVVGPSFETINQSFVILDTDFRFEVDTPLRAVDVVFKCIYALDAEYPAEASHVWQFIQRAVYGIPRHKSDPHFTDVEKLLNELANNIFNMPKCNECGQIVPYIRSLLVHLTAVHRIDDSYLYTCAENSCSRIFASSNSFRKHLQSDHKFTQCEQPLPKLYVSSVEPRAATVCIKASDLLDPLPLYAHMMANGEQYIVLR